jgi:hypothetical protein
VFDVGAVAAIDGASSDVVVINAGAAAAALKAAPN